MVVIAHAWASPPGAPLELYDLLLLPTTLRPISISVKSEDAIDTLQIFIVGIMAEWISKRIAKSFSGEELYFGSVTGYNETHKLWSLQYDDGDFEEIEWKDLNEAIKLYDNVMEHFSYGEDEITLNYEESKVWGVKLYDKDNLLVNSTDTNIRDARVCHTTPFFRFTDRLHAAGTALSLKTTLTEDDSLITFAKKSLPAKIKLGNIEGVLDHQNNMPFIYHMVSRNLLKAALMCKTRRGDVIKKLEYQEGDTRKIFLEGTMYIGDLIQQQQYNPIKITLQHTVKPLTLAINHKSQFNTNI